VYRADQCSRIIGKGGQTIKVIKRHSGCPLNLPPKPVGSEARKGETATFSGTRAQVDLGIAMVEALLMAPDDKYMEDVFTEAFFESRQAGGATAATVAQPSEAEASEQSVDSAAAVQVATVQKEYTPEEVRMLVDKGGMAIKALIDYSSCAVRQDRYPPMGSTAVAVSFRGTRAQVELAIEMVREVHAAYRAAHFAVQHTVAPDVAKRWRRAAEARAAVACAAGEASDVVSKGPPSADRLVYPIAGRVSAVEAAPCAAARGDGDGRWLNKETASAKTSFFMEYPVLTLGLIIGAKGSTMRSISRASGCHVSIEDRPLPGVGVQKVWFCGTQAQIDMAVGMVQFLVLNSYLDVGSYASKHAAQRQQPSNSGSPAFDEGRKQIGGPFADSEERLVRRAAAT